MDIIGTGPVQRFQKAPARVSLRGARAAYVGPGLGLAPHMNAVAMVAVGLDGPFELAMTDGKVGHGAYELQRAALIAPGLMPHLRSSGRMAFLYLDALGDDYAALRNADLDSFIDALTGIAPGQLSLASLCARLGLRQATFRDARIVALIRAIDAHPEDFHSLAVAAGAAGLSPSRLRVLIREAVGMPFSRYRLWLRMAQVCRELSARRSLTQAAHASGFASSAHLSTAFRRMFGLSPSTLIRAGVEFDVD